MRLGLLKMSFLRRIANPLLANYWAFFVLLSFVYMFFPKGLMFLIDLYLVAIFVYSYKWVNFSKLDGLICFYIFYCLLSYCFSDYPFSVFFYGIRWSILPMLMYFVAKSVNSVAYLSFFWGLRKPVLVACFCGILLYTIQPGFYMDYKFGNLDLTDLTDNALMELSRFSSFWAHSYCISYLCLFLLLRDYKLIIFDHNQLKAKENKMLLEVVFLFFIIVIAQQRVVIAYAALSFFFLYVYSFSMKNGASVRMTKILSVYLVLGFVIVIFASVLFGDVFVQYVTDRTFGYEGDEGMVEDRFALFEDSIRRISLFGEGFGKYGHAALEHKMLSITDCDYIRIPCEIGIFGFLILAAIFVVSLLKGVLVFHKVPVETLVVAFYPVAMIGAAPIYVTYMHPCMLWFCMGRIGLLYYEEQQKRRSVAKEILKDS